MASCSWLCMRTPPGQRPVDPSDALAGLLLAAWLDPGRIPAGRDAREGCWRDYLAGRKVLLVLDDATGYDEVRPLLPGGGSRPWSPAGGA